MRKKLLLTGAPGSGKTTLIQKVIPRLTIPAGGFYTREVREKGVRMGFEIITLDGRRGFLAHVDYSGPERVGKYGLDLPVLERLAVPAMQAAMAANGIVVIDEIGPMEVRSRAFCRVVLDVMDSKAILLGTIAKREHPFIEQIKAISGITLVEVRPDNRDTLPERIIGWLQD